MSNPSFSFSTVKRAQCKASILIEGLSGRGKSGLALVLARALADDWSKVFAVDTENGSLKLYDGINCTSGGKFQDFKVAEFTPDMGYKPTHFQMFKDAAIEDGAQVVIQDSISHAWAYSGGILDMLSEVKKKDARYQRDSYAAWGDDTIVKEKQLLNEMLRDYRCHVISTVRVKEKMEYDKDENGKTVLTSLGEQQIMQADLKYEPDLVLQMVSPGCASGAVVQYPKAKVSKSRYAIFDVGQEYEFTPELCAQLKAYLEEGTSPEELLQQQHDEYTKGIKEYLDKHQNAVPVWNGLKENKGYKGVSSSNIPLDVLKELWLQLTLN